MLEGGVSGGARKGKEGQRVEFPGRGAERGVAIWLRTEPSRPSIPGRGADSQAGRSCSCWNPRVLLSGPCSPEATRTLWALRSGHGMAWPVMLESRTHVLRFLVGLGWRGGEGVGRGPAVGAASSVGGWGLEDGGAGARKEGVAGMRAQRLGLLYRLLKF